MIAMQPAAETAPCFRRPRRSAARWRFLAAAAVAVTGTMAAGDESPERLIERLGAGSLAVRERAERELVALGPAVLPLVAAARGSAGAEAAFRLEAIERRLEGLAAERAVEATTLSMTAGETTARDALNALFAQAGGRIDLAREVADGAAGNRLLTVSGDRTTFWEALDDVLDRSGLELEFLESPPGLRIIDATRDASGHTEAAVLKRDRHAAAGPLRVAVAAVEPAGPAAVPGAAPGRGARVIIRVAWEPRFQPLLMRLAMRSIVAEGPAGETVPVAQRAAVIDATIPARRAWLDLPVRLAAPAVPVPAVAALRGTLTVWAAGLEHEFVMAIPGAVLTADRPAAGVLRVAQAEVRLVEATRVDDRLLVRASVSFDRPSEALASHHTWLAAKEMHALAGGIPLDLIEQRVDDRTERGLTAAASFALPAAAAAQEVTVRWRLPIAIHEIPVDFALRDVPLPEESLVRPVGSHEAAENGGLSRGFPDGSRIEPDGPRR
jgi:hypothetical protein